MTNSQCIEVAEKVWGWKKREADPATGSEEYRPIYWYEPNEHPGQLVPTCNLNQLKDEVNSWQGFGRTVEAMDKKGFRFGGTRFSIITAHQIKDFLIQKVDDWKDLKTFIPATHLAALEAIGG